MMLISCNSFHLNERLDKGADSLSLLFVHWDIGPVALKDDTEWVRPGAANEGNLFAKLDVTRDGNAIHPLEPRSIGGLANDERDALSLLRKFDLVVLVRRLAPSFQTGFKIPYSDFKKAHWSKDNNRVLLYWCHSI